MHTYTYVLCIYTHTCMYIWMEHDVCFVLHGHKADLLRMEDSALSEGREETAKSSSLAFSSKQLLFYSASLLNERR